MHETERITKDKFKEIFQNFTKEELSISEFEITRDFYSGISIIVGNKLHPATIRIFTIIDIKPSYKLEEFLISLGLIKPINTVDVFISKEMLIKIFESDYAVTISGNPDYTFYDIIKLSINDRFIISISYRNLKSLADNEKEIEKYMKKLDLKILEETILIKKEELKKEEIKFDQNKKGYQNKLASLTDEEKIYLQLKGVI